MADSKLLYSSGKGLRLLETGLLAALGLLGHRPRTWREVWQALRTEALEQMPAIPWHAEFDQPAPCACQAEAIERLVEILAAGMTRAGVRLVALRSRAIFEAEFNDLCDGHGSKGGSLVARNAGLGRPSDRSTSRGEKGTGTICRNGPAGAAHKWCLSPFRLRAR